MGKEALQTIVDLIRAKYQGVIDIEVEPQENSISVKDLEIFYKSFGLNSKVRTKDEVL